MRTTHAIALSLLLAACKATVPEGQLKCATVTDCPKAWLCLGDTDSKHCYSSTNAWNKKGGGADAGNVTPGTGGRKANDAGGAVGDSAVDAGDSGTDAGIVGDPTAAVFTLGDLCYHNAELACAGFNSALTLVCSGGLWKQAGTCPGTQRCDSRLGNGQGLCLDILPECVKKQPGDELCDGNNRIACGPDRLTFTDPEPCPTGDVCDLKNGVGTCVPDTDECALNTDNCDSDPDACKNALGTFTCECPPGFMGDGVGESGCLDIDECATDNGGCGDASIWKCTNNLGAPPTCENTGLCGKNNGGCSTAPMALCMEVAGSKPTCQCPPGYEGDGVGPHGCKDIDECSNGAVAACGTGATDCKNTDGSYECTCESPYFYGTGTVACHDVNECTSSRTSPCSSTEPMCINNVGGPPSCCACCGTVIIKGVLCCPARTKGC